MKSAALPIPVEPDLQRLIAEVAGRTGLSKADVMRLGLRHGVPQVARQFDGLRQRRQPACLAWLDEYPTVPEAKLRERKAAFREALKRKHASHR